VQDINILIVDDDEDILMLYRHYLIEEVSQVDCISDPREAIKRLKFKKYDLLITDILMPFLNGIELTKEVHEIYPDLPVLVCSEGGTTEAREIVAGIVLNKAISFGATFALKKPFKKTELLASIKESTKKD